MQVLMAVGVGGGVMVAGSFAWCCKSNLLPGDLLVFATCYEKRLRTDAQTLPTAGSPLKPQLPASGR